MSDFQNKNDVAQAARVTGNRDVVTLDSYYKWLAQGKVFEAGQGLQTDAIDSQAETTLTPDDVKATFALVAPAGVEPIVIPLFVKVSWEVEGGAATDFQLIFTKSAGDCATTLSLSGLNMVSRQCMYATNPAKTAHQASALKGVATTYLLTVSALTDADQCMYEFAALVDNNVATPLTDSSRVWMADFVHGGGAPHALSQGAAMIFYISSATSDAKIHPYIQWAEVDLDDLV